MSSAFKSLVSPQVRAEIEDWQGLDGCLDALLGDARRAWPQFVMDDDLFLRHLGARVPESGARAFLEQVRAGDLYLACAYIEGMDGAFAAIDAQCRGDLSRCIARLDCAEPDDVRQSVYERLFFVPSRAEARIGQYRGQGDLRRWVRTSGLRLALNMARDTWRERSVGVDTLDDLVSVGKSFEDEAIGNTFRQAFRDAFTTAWNGLSPRDRNLLRYYYVDGLSLIAIGKMRGTHRVTVARWLRRTKEELRATTFARLAHILPASQSSLESWLRNEASVSVSVAWRALADDAGAEPADRESL